MAKTDRSQMPTFTKTKLAAAIAAASGLAAPAPVSAQESAGASPAIEEVIVTARKREANIQDTAVSIQAFTEDDLDRMDLDRFEDFADQSPSISYVSAGPGTQLMHIRGVSDGGIPHVFRTNDATTSFYLRRAAGERPQRRCAGPAPLRHRAHRGAARPGRHVLRRKFRLRDRAHHHQQARSRGPELRHGLERWLDRPRRHRLHRRGGT